jgi:putative transposase
MPRPPRVHVPNGVFHVIQCATDHEVLFANAVDHQEFDSLLDLTVRRCGWKPHLSCHLTTHVHLVIQTPEPLARGMQFLMSQYVQEFNVRHHRRGTLVQSRYWAELIETEQRYENCLNYVELNPVTAGLCRRPEDWPWTRRFERRFGSS